MSTASQMIYVANARLAERQFLREQPTINKEK